MKNRGNKYPQSPHVQMTLAKWFLKKKLEVRYDWNSWPSFHDIEDELTNALIDADIEAIALMMTDNDPLKREAAGIAYRELLTYEEYDESSESDN